MPVLLALSAWAVVTLAALSALKGAALLAGLRGDGPPPASMPLATPPMVSLLVPLYREAAVATRLVRRLERLDYPRDRLEVLLVAEADDAVTQAALARADLPVWMRLVAAPPGRVRTKPRALNLALDLCRGAIVGVYDAEDAPAPDQLRRVVARFAARPPEVACLQGVLDFYNPRRSWLSRCFTLEYAGWFRVILPGLARLGLPVPLGGTTLFFRRAALEALGGWDAHNVTEDADLGIRLARRGLRTELVPTVTEEEATCRPLPWVRQRSRWIKGYMMTWAVHMRRPAQLWRDLGPAGFLGFQTLFLGTLSQALLAPVLWSFWLVALGAGHPVAAALPGGVLSGMMGLFLACELLNLAVALAGLRRRGGGVGALWCLTLPLYFPLAVLAAYKALWELARSPFYWDKTAHGLRPATA
jgi:cellulose synthase/poly-beta-1,6-N-acetylglucosamine synthase-like glycosyltransferase